MYYVHIQEAGRGKMRNEQNKLDREIGQNPKSRSERGTLIKERSLLPKSVGRHLPGSCMKVMGRESIVLSDLIS